MVQIRLRPFVNFVSLTCALTWASVSWGQHASEQDFTAEYWPASTSSSVCPTGFRALPVPRFKPRTDATGKSVVRSDQFRETDDGNRYFSGSVKVQTEDLLLTAEELEWLDEGPLDFEHGLSLYHEQGAMGIDKAVFDLDAEQRSADLEALSFVLFDFPMQGSLGALKADESQIEANQLRLSGCDPGAERWGFRIKRIRINRDTTRVKLNGVGFYVGKLPVFYVPFFTFRLQPDEDGFFDNTRFDYRSDNGLIVAQPFRVRYDHGSLAFTPKWLSKNGAQLSTNIELFGFDSVVDWVPDDRLQDDPLPDGLVDEKRWRVKGNLKESWGNLKALVDFTQTSDFAYQHDFEFDSLTQPMFATTNTANLNYASRDWLVDLAVQRFNSTSAKRLLGERTPELHIRWRPRWGIFHAVTHLNRANYRNPTRELDRTHYEQRLTAELTRPWGELVVGGGWSETDFQADAHREKFDSSRHSDDVQISAGLVFDRWATQHLVTLEPRLHYLNRQVDETTGFLPFDVPRWTLQRNQLFGDPRPSGLDYLRDEERMNVGVRLSAIPHADSRTVMQTSIAHVTRFNGLEGQSDSVQGLGLALSLKNAHGFAIEHRHYHSEATDAFNEFASFLVYEPSHQKSLYASFGKRERDAVHQAEFGFRWPLSARWQAIGAAAFDRDREELTDSHFGFTYTGCCFRATLLFQRAIDWDFIGTQYQVALENRVMVRFDLSGLGSVGEKRIESLIDRKRFALR